MNGLKYVAFSLLTLGLLSARAGFAVEAITPQEAAALVERNSAILIDVRERDELERTGTAEPAVWLAISEVRARGERYKAFIDSIDRGTALVFFCHSGRRAGWVARHFESLGFKVYNMGGFDDWQEAGLPTRAFGEASYEIAHSR